MPEPTYDPETLRKVAQLAARMQSEQEARSLAAGQKLTAEEMERIGGEVGLSPALMRQALGYLQAQNDALAKAKVERKRQALLGLLACSLFLGAGAIAGYKWYVNSAALRQAAGDKPWFSWPQVSVYFHRSGEPTLEEVVESRPKVAAPADDPDYDAAIDRYLTWVKYSETERYQLASRLVAYGEQMKNGVGGSPDQVQALIQAPVEDLQRYLTAFEGVDAEVPRQCRHLYMAYRRAIREDVNATEDLARAFFAWRPSDANRFGIASTRRIVHRYEVAASEQDELASIRSRAQSLPIDRSDTSCFLRALNRGMGNF
jgi:hypothetical protein